MCQWMKHRHAIRYPLIGVLLGTGAPMGWLGWRMLQQPAGGDRVVELSLNPGLYLYLLVGTCLVLAVSGAVAGHLTDRLVEASERLKKLATLDALTGLQNAGQFQGALAVECARAERPGPLTGDGRPRSFQAPQRSVRARDRGQGACAGSQELSPPAFARVM
jgi:hypothetical protein